ncbi:hypothetical protein EC988_000465, partial [Linderina pennispora]
MLVYYLSSAVAAYAASQVIYRLFISPLRKIPGPWLARLSRLPYYYTMGTGSTSAKGRSDYHQYGDIYVMAPDMVSVSHPDDCKRIMSSYEFRKADFYQSMAIIDDTILSTLSPELNRMRRRQFGPMFTPSYLAGMEKIIMECGIRALKQRWSQRLGQQVNYAEDFSLCMVDVINTLCY